MKREAEGIDVRSWKFYFTKLILLCGVFHTGVLYTFIDIALYI